MSDSAKPQTRYLKDYAPPPYAVSAIQLRFELFEESARVTSTLEMQRQHRQDEAGQTPLMLDGHDMTLHSVTLDGQKLDTDAYIVEPERLVIANPPERFTLEIVTSSKPQDNASLEGLYRSGDMFCTQCEAEGFRKITYYPDRPDVMAPYTVTIEADKARYPTLLSNGNRIDGGDLPDGRRFAVWQDPFPKPSYLFALVAGNLGCLRDAFITQSGRRVALELYAREQDVAQCHHAMAALKKSMRWDEERFGREYDLDVYMIVAVGDFNMGAMENKGLNIFNTKYVLANPDTATDSEYEGIDSVIAHEYFHNWSGNRVTCRDWFQLSLKEGLTVFRDQEFSSDIVSGPVQRINDVRVLRSHQFPEDAGPTAHPVQPDSYIEINNFYTNTVYNKGAEVVRMLQTLLGRDGFRKGLDLYFERHDGQAVTVEEFISAMEAANGRALTQFRLWYVQAGTPQVRAALSHDAASQRLTLTLRQSCPATPGQSFKQPFHIPIATALLDQQGQAIPLRLVGESNAAPAPTERVLELRATEESFHFDGVAQMPTPSLLRGFSAPVKLDAQLDNAQLAFLWAHDSDPFNRWESGQEYATRVMLGLVAARARGDSLNLDENFVDAFRACLQDDALDPALRALALTLPSEGHLMERMTLADPQAAHAIRSFVRAQLSVRLEAELLTAYHAFRVAGAYRYAPLDAGRRALRNLCLDLLLAGQDSAAETLALNHYHNADNMTDRLAAITPIIHGGLPHSDKLIADFYIHCASSANALDKWFSIQASAPLPDALPRVRALMTHQDFSLRNPNKVRAVIGAFCGGNPVRFHDASGAGYAFLAEQVLALDAANPQAAARMVALMSRWRRFRRDLAELMQKQLQRILTQDKLSNDVYEIVSKSLNAPADD
ncbi:aminopeptidase N [Magnetofaba australis]|uniref:Aminopeptidase N n=1 Tax=Magnetofaba australis IT-1 TaxID=1434232 RepID=A0A1Y2K687_9PROT|nr:aminopeptidase N [Magnetofaba australis]OSM05063.1 putative aminopeptidase N [Magnetofaba australis IT-1]